MSTAPARVGELLPGVLADVLNRAADPEGYERWSQLVAQTGHCAHPIRLAGGVTAVDTITGEARTVYATAGEPDGVLLTACNNRRASVCPSCSATYAADTWQLVAAGLRGGKGLPETVAVHPRLLVTLTAPSFGSVHGRVEEHGQVRPCRARRRFALCPHGRPRSCPARHGEDDQALGAPLCPDCYDYDAAVLFNAMAPELWRRFVIYLRRDLARGAGLTQAQLAGRVRLRFAKVAEGQRRGVVHFHAVLRLDAAPPREDPGRVTAPPAPFTAELLSEAVRAAAARVTVVTPSLGEDEPGLVLAWGEQLDVRPISHGAGEGEGGQLDERAVAAYLAKYVTKATGTTGLADRRFTPEQVVLLDPARHLDRMALTAWRLGGRSQLQELGLRRWAHMLGFRGHVATRSRAYSTTLGRLRQARRDYRVRQRHGDAGPLDPWGRPLRAAGDGDDRAEDEGTVLLLASWRYAGRGHRSIGDAWLAETAAARAREHRDTRRLEAIAFLGHP